MRWCLIKREDKFSFKINFRLQGFNSLCLCIQQAALDQGLQQVLWLYGEDHLITEVGTMNIFVFCINDDGGNFLHL